MPHLTIDYSANVDGAVDMAALCAGLHEAMVATGLFELGAIRVRALRAEAWAVADRDPRNGYVDMALRLAEGRSLEDRKRAGDLIFKAAEKVLAPLLAGEHFALSLEIREIDARLGWKNNSIHPRLRAARDRQGS